MVATRCHLDACGRPPGRAGRRAAAQPRRHPEGPARPRGRRRRPDDGPSAGHPVAVRQRGRRAAVRVPLTIGPPLPGERNSTSAPTIAGVTPGGDALAIAVTAGDHPHPSGLPLVGVCDLCRLLVGFRRPRPARPARRHPPGGGDQGARARDPRRSGRAGSRPAAGGHVHRGLGRLRGPRFPLLRPGRRQAGPADRRGRGQPFDQVAELVRRAEMDAGAASCTSPDARAAAAAGLDGPERESANDGELMRRRHPPRGPEPVPAVARRRVRTVAEPDGRSSGRHPDVATLRAHGIEAPLPAGLRGPDLHPPGRSAARVRPVAHFATFPCPRRRRLRRRRSQPDGAHDIFAALFEYGPESVGTTLFDRQGMPALDRGHFRPTVLRGVSAGSRAPSGSSPRPAGPSPSTRCSAAMPGARWSPRSTTCSASASISPGHARPLPRTASASRGTDRPLPRRLRPAGGGRRGQGGPARRHCPGPAARSGVTARPVRPAGAGPGAVAEAALGRRRPGRAPAPGTAWLVAVVLRWLRRLRRHGSRRRGGALASCGCFGTPDTPATGCTW